MNNGSLTKLTISAFTDIKLTPPGAGTFNVLFNPNSYTLKYEVDYNSSQGIGTTGTPQQFNKIKPREFSLEFILDGTGVASDKIDVKDTVSHFLNLSYEYNGEMHRPYYLRVTWGTLDIRCILKSADVTYNLFAPDGRPLRGKIVASFSEVLDDKLRVAKDWTSSPDLTHTRVISFGDTLTTEVYKIYGDPKYYIEVARANGLSNVRRLKTGSKVFFPPLDINE